MFHRLSNYNAVMDRFFFPGMASGCVSGTVYGAYVCTDPYVTQVRFRDALFGGIIGAALGTMGGGLAVAMYPIVAVTPLVAFPYMYNRYKMESR